MNMNICFAKLSQINSDLAVKNINLAGYKNANVVSTVSNCVAHFTAMQTIIQLGTFLIDQHFNEKDVVLFRLPELLPVYPAYFILSAYADNAELKTIRCKVDIVENVTSIIALETPARALYCSGQVIFFNNMT